MVRSVKVLDPPATRPTGWDRVWKATSDKVFILVEDDVWYAVERLVKTARSLLRQGVR